MAIQGYSTQAQRTALLAGEIIGHAIPTEVLGNVAKQLKMPKNKSNVLKVRSWVPYGGSVAAPNTFSVDETAHITTEGVTPTADTIVPRDVTITLQQYMCLYAFTDQTYDLYEDDIPEAMKEQTGERMGLIREKVLYGAYKACTNLFYSGGTSRATVDEKINETFMRRITRSLRANHAMPITNVLDPSANYDTIAVEASFVCFAHTDCEADIRDLPDFTPVAKYGNRKTICDEELGTWNNVRFVLSPELTSIADSGAAISGTTNYSTTGTNADVYPCIIMGKEAACALMLRGMEAVMPIWVPPKPSAADPGGQRGYVGAKFYFAADVLNDGWMAVGEVAISALT